jgi:hypothetical protein
LYTVIYILIAVGILSVINGTVATGVKIYEDLIKNKEIVFSSKFDVSKKYNGKPMSGVLYGFTVTFIFFIFCTAIGIFFADTGGYVGQGFDSRTAGIFSFSDIISN